MAGRPRIDRSVRVAVVFVAMAACWVGLARPSAQTFRGEVTTVEIPVTVTDRQGRLVRDLTKDDFEVFEDGKLQTVSTFALVDIPIERAERPVFVASCEEAIVLGRLNLPCSHAYLTGCA